MKYSELLAAWRAILSGRKPFLSIEITRECPLRCPGCYAYGDEHLGGGVTLRQVRDFKGQELIDKFLKVVDHHRPLHVSIVGGEPLVRYRELGVPGESNAFGLIALELGTAGIGQPLCLAELGPETPVAGNARGAKREVVPVALITRVDVAIPGRGGT